MLLKRPFPLARSEAGDHVCRSQACPSARLTTSTTAPSVPPSRRVASASMRMALPRRPRPVVSSTSVSSVNVPPTSTPTMNLRPWYSTAHGDDSRRDPTSLDAQDAGSSVARGRRAGHRPRRRRLGVDGKGQKLMDGFAGLAVVNVGHGRREIAEAIAEQTVKLAYYPTTRQFSNRPAAQLAAKLATLTPGDLDLTMFAVSGSEANERSMQIARHYWMAKGKADKHKVISFLGGYHGATMGTFAICGLPHLAAPYAKLQPAGFAKVAPPHPYRDRGTGTDAPLIEQRGRELREATVREGPDTVSAVILEPVLSSGGFIMPPIGWLKKVRAICDELDVLMIADEVITGFGRTGRWFAVEHDGVVPDLMSVAKGITSGYIPLSASIATHRLAGVFPDDTKEENVHPNTYAAHPVACAAALANLKIMEQDRLVENAAK